MSIISFTDKNSETKLKFVGSTIPVSGSPDPDPHQNEADPKLGLIPFFKSLINAREE